LIYQSINLMVAAMTASFLSIEVDNFLLVFFEARHRSIHLTEPKQLLDLTSDRKASGFLMNS